MKNVFWNLYLFKAIIIKRSGVIENEFFKLTLYKIKFINFHSLKVVRNYPKADLLLKDYVYSSTLS
jgi:hypothetical protein